jgi:hypothetical protein
MVRGQDREDSGPSDVAEERMRLCVLSAAMISLWVGRWRSKVPRSIHPSVRGR